MEPIEEDPLADIKGKAYVAGITCDPEDGWCPYSDMVCVGRYID